MFFQIQYFLSYPKLWVLVLVFAGAGEQSKKTVVWRKFKVAVAAYKGQ